MACRIIAVTVGVLLIAMLGVANAQTPPGLVSHRTQEGDGIERLMAEMTALSLPSRIERALMLTLQAADAALHQGRMSEARVLLRTFANEVRGVRRARRLSVETADVLLAKAEGAAGGSKK